MFGRRKPPAKLRPRLDRGERVLAWARTSGDPNQVVVVTTLGLWLPGRERLGWHQIHKATWAGSRLTVVPAVARSDNGVPNNGASDGGSAGNGVAYTVMVDDTPVLIDLSEPGDVPVEVRKRVTRSVAYTAHHPLDSGGVRVVARRVAGMDGLTWHVRYDEGTDPADPQVEQVTTELVAEAATPMRPE